MEFGLLHVRCGPYRILVPGDNVLGIDPPPEQAPAKLSLHQARQKGWPPMIDARLYLGSDPAKTLEPGVIVHWRASGREACASLIVDGVEGLRGGYEADVLPLPRVPRLFRLLFDGLVYDSSGGFLLRLRQDAQPVLDDFDSRRRFCRAIVGHQQSGGN
jgi:hypothetical protein